VRTDSRTLPGQDSTDTMGRVLGLPGSRVMAAAEVRGELELVVETTGARTGVSWVWGGGEPA
jgi:hypothetical protein